MRKYSRHLSMVGVVVVALAIAVGFQNCDGYNNNELDLGSRAPEIPQAKCQDNATLSWTIPVTNADGTALSTSELGGYKIFYGLASRSYATTVDVKNGLTNTHIIDKLSPGVYYFAVKAYKSDGAESQYSNEAVLNLSNCSASVKVHLRRKNTTVASVRN